MQLPLDEWPGKIDEPDMKNGRLAELLNTPRGLVIALGLLIAVVEIVVHGALIFLDVADVYPEFVDAVLLSIILSPALYFLVFRRLQESEERYRFLFENMLEGCAYCKMLFERDTPLDFIYLNVNDAFGKITGLKDVVGKKVTEVIPGIRASNPELFEVYGRVALTGKPEKFETYINALGSWFSITAYGTENEYFTAVFDNITERKLAEKTLSESNGRFHHLVETMSDWIWEVDENTVYTYASRKIHSILGYEAAEIIGKTPFDLMPPEEAKRVADIFGPIKAAGKSFTNLENTNLHKDGHPVVLETSGVPVIDAEGKFRGYRGINRDVTERKQMEKESLEAGARIRDALEVAIGAIAATLEQRDPYTAGHQRRVAQLAVAIGEEMGLAPEALEGIHFGGLIHDIGKISVPVEILGKPGHITDIELGLIKIHAEAGYEIVKGITFPWPVADMVRQHHERLDGSGYPQGLKDGEIILEARIMAVADVVEAMLANRPYRAGLGMDAALGEIARTRGTQLDPVAVDACLRVIKENGFAFTHG